MHKICTTTYTQELHIAGQKNTTINNMNDNFATTSHTYSCNQGRTNLHLATTTDTQLRTRHQKNLIFTLRSVFGAGKGLSYPGGGATRRTRFHWLTVTEVTVDAQQYFSGQANGYVGLGTPGVPTR